MKKWRYRLVSIFGTMVLATLAVLVGNQPLIQAGFRLLPILGHLPFDVNEKPELILETGTATFVVLMSLVPLYKPRPRRILDTAALAIKRVLLACVTLAAIGYFDYTYRLPRATLIIASAFLCIWIPVWFVAIRRQPREDGERTLIVGDDPETMDNILAAVEGKVIGYVSPPSAYLKDPTPPARTPKYADGGKPNQLDDLLCLGGLSQLDNVLVEYDIDSVVLAFSRPDRAEFFGTLDTCYEHGIGAKVHRNRADSVLTTGVTDGELVDVDLEPWDWFDRVIKRVFDISFSLISLITLFPVIFCIVIAIKLEDRGPVFYRQERTASLGNTFNVYKFRSMVQNAESISGAKLSEEDNGGTDPRVTRVGKFVRKTHLDEIPQLWSILSGEMSVVGPRPERPELDREMEINANEWRSRWFVKPGLTGLAQINGITGHNPEQKLRYDIEYIRKQSFWFDLKIVLRQVWQVLQDGAETVLSQ